MAYTGINLAVINIGVKNNLNTLRMYQDCLKLNQNAQKKILY